jgi:hypothetical protein
MGLDSEPDDTQLPGKISNIEKMLQNLIGVFSTMKQDIAASQHAITELNKNVVHKQDIAEINRNMAVIASRVSNLEKDKGLPGQPADLSGQASASLAHGKPRLSGPGILPFHPPSVASETQTSQLPTHGGRVVPRYHKLEFPIFDGKSDPLSWINRCEQFFRGQRTEEPDKIWLATYHLIGVAQEWYYQRERSKGAPQREEFKELCHLRFGPHVRSNALGELKQLQ